MNKSGDFGVSPSFPRPGGSTTCWQSVLWEGTWDICERMLDTWCLSPWGFGLVMWHFSLFHPEDSDAQLWKLVFDQGYSPPALLQPCSQQPNLLEQFLVVQGQQIQWVGWNIGKHGVLLPSKGFPMVPRWIQQFHWSFLLSWRPLLTEAAYERTRAAGGGNCSQLNQDEKPSPHETKRPFSWGGAPIMFWPQN